MTRRAYWCFFIVLPSRRERRRPACRRAFRLVTATAVAALLGACGTGTKPPPPPPSGQGSAGPCSASVRDPTCQVLWGISAGPASISSLERSIGRRFDLVYFFDAIDSADLPDAAERKVVASGQTLHINLESREFGKAGHPVVPWSSVAAGEFDATLRQAARGLAELRKPFFVTFDHEADAPAKVNSRGTAAQFVAAWRHVRQVFLDAGATQAIWTWVVTGFRANFAAAQALYPGNDAVDWISWDPYDARGCQTGSVGSSPPQTFAEVAKPFYDWLATTGAQAGISLQKPYMISETGSAFDPSRPAATAAYYRSIPAGLRELPRIRAVTIWDQAVGTCDYRVDGVQQLRPALRAAADQLLHASG